MTTPTDVREIVKQKYGAAARSAAEGRKDAGCCTSSETGCDPITSNLYDAAQLGTLPVEAVIASLGCGNPTALAELKPGEVVLDLGSGGGIDVLLSARRVAPTGKAYGLDMTDDMLALARENQQRSRASRTSSSSRAKSSTSRCPTTRSTSSSRTASSTSRPTRSACSPKRSAC